ncbi:MAG: hypothetical protein ACXWFA_14105 [Methylobacter sp.]
MYTIPCLDTLNLIKNNKLGYSYEVYATSGIAYIRFGFSFMALIELLSKLRGENLFPIRVESIPDRTYDLEFVGSLSEFIEAAKAIQSPVVFVSTITLSEDDFLWDNPDSDEIDIDEYVDLCRYVPELKEYKSKIGENGHIDLCASGLNSHLKFAVVEDWMAIFEGLHSQAVEMLRGASLEKQAQEEAAEDARIKHLLNNLRGLITDMNFVRLPTQRAMLAYALDDFPELETLGERVLKVEIQNLKARIDAQGLRQK